MINFTNYSKNKNRDFCLERQIEKINEKYIFENNSNIQNLNVRSLSIMVPTKKCINSCKFCVSKISQKKAQYDNLSDDEAFEELYFEKFKMVSEMGCENAILTGTGEPLQNKKFLSMIGRLNKKLNKPFHIEIQTTGALLNIQNLNFLKNEVGVSLISLSVSNIFNDESNADIITMPEKIRFNLKKLCYDIKSLDFVLRISLNLVNIYNKYEPKQIIDRLKTLKADQAIFRVLWAGKEDDEISNWIRNNSVAQDFIKKVQLYLETFGKKISANFPLYLIQNISIVVDEDCMAEKTSNEIRYLILRSDCNLYTKWDTKTSIFK